MIKHTTIESAILSFARIGNILSGAKAIGKEDQYRNLISDVIYKLKHTTPNCDLGVLWNALTEKKEEKMLYSFNKTEDPLEIHADSGGLQQITLGIKVDEAEKQAIYQRQAKYSTHAMSFDKMPILVDDRKKDSNLSMCLDQSSKYFIRELLYDVGRESGFNVLDQCKAMTKMPKEDINAKILVIIQGSRFDDYQEYARGLFSVFEELPENEREKYYEHIGGLSMGMSGITNYFELVDLYCRAPADLTAAPEKFRNLIHFLGVGGPTKIAPLYAIAPDFYGDRDIHYTFDSTSRTSCSTYGKYTTLNYDKGHLKTSTNGLGRKLNETVYEHLGDVYKEYKDIINKNLDIDISDIEKYRENFSPYREDSLRKAKEITEKYGELKGREIYLNAVLVNDFLHWATEMIKFFELLDNYSDGDFRVLNNKVLKQAIDVLHKCKTHEDYMNGPTREFLRMALSKISLGNINILETMYEFEHLDDASIEDTW